jgi:thiol-disulfide isomerase/thioredoxin
LVINFWATWCAPCLREIPLLKSFQADHPEFQLVGIAVDRLQAVRQFADEMQFNYPVLVGQAEGMNAAASFGVDVFALPFTVFTAPDGATLGLHTGELHSEHLAELAATVAALGDGSLSLEQARARTAGIR